MMEFACLCDWEESGPIIGAREHRGAAALGRGGEIMSPIWSILGSECLWARQASYFLKIKGL